MRKTLVAIGTVILLTFAAGSAEAGWEEGIAAFKAGNYSQAAQEFQAVAESRPDWPGGHYMLGQALLKLNRKDDALRSLRKAYDLNPNDVSYQMTLSSAYLKAGRFAEAARLLERIDVNSLPAAQQKAYHQWLAVAMEKSGRSGEALEAFRKAAQANPSDAKAQFAYGTTAFNAGQTSEAVRALAKAVSLNGNDQKMRAAYVKALIRQARENPSAKTQAYQTAVSQAKSLATANPSYDNYLQLGEVQMGAKQYGDAASSLRTAISKKSSDWLAHYYLSQALTASGDYSAAEKALLDSLRQNPADANQRRIWKQQGFVYEKLKQLDAAKQAYQKAGDAAGVARVQGNIDIANENQEIEAENAAIAEMEAERQRLEDELRELGAPPPRR